MKPMTVADIEAFCKRMQDSMIAELQAGQAMHFEIRNDTGEEGVVQGATYTIRIGRPAILQRNIDRGEAAKMGVVIQ